MHENANITCAIAETEMSFSIVLSMQPRSGGGGGASREDLIGGIAKDMEDRYYRKYGRQVHSPQHRKRRKM